MPHSPMSFNATCSHAQTSSIAFSTALGNFAMQRLPASSRTEAFGRPPPRLEPAASKSRTSASISEAARSVEASSEGMLVSRGTPDATGDKARLSASQNLSAPVPGDIVDPDEHIDLEERPRRSLVLLRALALGAQHQVSSPAIGHAVSEGAKLP